MTKAVFTSDNYAGASQSVVDAIANAAHNQAMPYGDDSLTATVTSMLSDLFECDLDVFLVTTGTAANVLSLSAMTQVWGSVFCHKQSHILQDESTAPEFYTSGARLIGVDGKDGKIDPDQLQHVMRQKVGDVHSCQAAALSLSQVTEVGSVYSLEEIKVLSDIARSMNVPVHMDGARFANAIVSLGCRPADMTWKSGVDILSFGATKNGAMAVEAIVVFNKTLASNLGYLRKRGGHLLSKMCFLSAQMQAYLTDELWLRNAKHANTMMARLQKELSTIPNVKINTPAQANMLFCTLPDEMSDHLLREGFSFYTGRWAPGVVRFVTSFRTQAEEIDALIASAKSFAQ